jgi:hypothetical protein
MSEYHVNISDEYNIADASHDGSMTHPFCYSECDTLVGAGTVNGITFNSGDTVRLTGEVVAASVELFRSTQMSLVIKSWAGREPWKMEDESSGARCYFQLVNAEDTLDVYDGIIGGIYADGGAANTRITFYNCLTWAIEAYSQTTSQVRTYKYKQCSIAGDVILQGAAFVGAGTIYFEDCVGVDGDISDNFLWGTVEFTGINIFNQSQTDVNQLDGTTTETGWETCTFSHALAADVPDYDDVTLDGIKYFNFNLPIIFSQPGRWDSSLSREGWFDKFRYGYGAFYFAFDTNISASPEHGTAPLEVQFTADATEGLVDENDGYEWDFGDGTGTKEKDPKHIYIPGEFSACVTVTTLWGEEIVECVTVYVYENDYRPGGRNVTKTSKIFRLGIPQQKKQGIGWSEYTGNDYPKAIGLIGSCIVFTDEDEERVIVTDCNSFKHYWLGKEDYWQDGGNAEYGGSEIASDILFRELVPPIRATAKLKHAESEANLKPWIKTRRNTGDYGAYGFRSAFTASMYFREDSVPVDKAEVKYFPRKAQIVSDRHIESEAIQAGLRITGAPWRMATMQIWYEQIDTAAAPAEKQMNEKTWAEMLESSIIWIGRSRDLVSLADGSHTMPWDKGSNQRTTGSFSGAIQGPDGYSLSAIAFGTSDNMIVSQNIPAGDLSILLWIKSPVSSCVLMSSSLLEIRIEQNGDGYDLFWNDSVTSWNIFLPYDFSQWGMISLIRYTSYVEIGLNGSFINLRKISSTLAFNGPITFYGGQVNGFEPRVISSALSENAVRWIYNDVIENNGNVTCAMY